MKSIGLARLGRDAEVRYLANGDAVANLSLAVNYYSKEAEHNRATQWVDATLWGKQAEALSSYLVKGSVHCFALSDIHIETYQDRDGNERFKLVARVDSVELGPRQGESASAPAAAPKPAAGKPKGAAPAPASKPQAGFDDMDDDIPF